MKTLKMSLESIHGKLSRNEMKNINGGQNQPAAGGSCCVKSIFRPEYGGGTYYWGCNYSQSDAINLATSIGIEGAAHGYWCCASC